MPKRVTLKVLITVPDNWSEELIKRSVIERLNTPAHQNANARVVQVDHINLEKEQ